MIKRESVGLLLMAPLVIFFAGSLIWLILDGLYMFFRTFPGIWIPVTGVVVLIVLFGIGASLLESK